jgi:ABC-type sugar transport system permease subunit
MMQDIGPQSREQAVQSVSWGDALRVWWAWFWRTVLFSLIVGFVLGGILGFFLATRGYGEESIEALSGLVGLLIGAVIGIVVMKHILEKGFGGFRLRVERRGGG